MLRLTAEKFHYQVMEAMTSVKEIYTLTNVPIETSVSRDLITEELLTDLSIDFRDISEVNKIITQDDETDKPPSEFEQELENLTAEYDTALEIFQNLENIDYGSSKIVARTAQPARCLTVKMLLLAKQIQSRPPKPNDPQRVLISLRLNQLRKQYNNPELSAQTNPQEIKRQVAEQIDEWLAVNAAEKQIIEESISKLVIAADTGRKLSKLIDDYANLNFEVIATRVTQIIGVTANLTGRDYSSVLTKMKTLESAINEDPTLRDFIREVSIKNRRTQLSQPKLCQEI
ncbi:hypothetical protein [Nostoc sp. UHCC 0870]|uniref:hypothetical protein n=1 Tax=Nostoc sp. UHCC 0870 TaxID=2914041 RepID=UPI001EDDE605|nr:hypothetical protein [Nostoc sp. UHCC 0870]UKO97890.1 hypothetical protein L6494_25620 [Nostoc sp. UHCC 0870]